MVHIKSHIVKRVLEVLRNEGINNIHPFQIHSLLKTKRIKTDKSNNNNFMKVCLPIKPLTNLTERTFNQKHFTDNVTDEVIHAVEIEGNEDPVFYFSIHKNLFVKHALSGVISNVSQVKNDGKRIIVEFSSPNIAKPFHMGHLRSTIVGNFVANMNALAHKVFRLNYLGDWGTQVGFVKVGLEKLEIKPSQLSGDPIKKLYEAYVKANEDANLLGPARAAFSRLETGEDLEGISDWEIIRCITTSHLEKMYQRLGVQFDEYAWESNYMLQKIQSDIEMLESRGLISRHNGLTSIIINGSEAPFLKSDGSTLYLSRDIAAALDRVKKYNCDRMLYVVDKSQSEHLRLLKSVVKNIVDRDVVEHIPFGRIVGMSSRKGTGIFLSDILDKSAHQMKLQQDKSPNTRSSNPEVTNNLAVSTLKIYVLRQSRMKDFRFDWNLALQGTGDTGVKLQYSHCRLVSLEKNCGVNVPETCDPTLLAEPVTLQLINELERFEEVLLICKNELESAILVNYLFILCNLVSKCLKILPVKGEQVELAEQRLLLFHVTRLVLNRGMQLLGLQPLDYM